MKKLQDELLLNKVRRGLEDPGGWGGGDAWDQGHGAGIAGRGRLFLGDGADSDAVLPTFSHQEQLLAEMERMQMEIDQLRGRPPSSYSR